MTTVTDTMSNIGLNLVISQPNQLKLVKLHNSNYSTLYVLGEVFPFIARNSVSFVTKRESLDGVIGGSKDQ